MLIETSENLTGRPRFWLSVVAISDWRRGGSTTRGTAMRATTNKTTTTPPPISSQVRSPLIAPCGSAPCSSALLDRRQPEAARPDRPRERPVLLERLRLSVRAIDDGTGGVVHDPVEHLAGEKHRDEVLARLLPGLAHLGSPDVDAAPASRAAGLAQVLTLRRHCGEAPGGRGIPDAPEIAARDRLLPGQATRARGGGAGLR